MKLLQCISTEDAHFSVQSWSDPVDLPKPGRERGGLESNVRTEANLLTDLRRHHAMVHGTVRRIPSFVADGDEVELPDHGNLALVCAFG